MLGHEVTKQRGGARACRTDTIDVTFTGSAGNSLRRVRADGHHAAADRRRQRLRRQGPVGRPDHRAPAAERVRSPRTRSSPATCCLYGATSGERVHPRRGRRAVLRAQLRRHRRRRGRGRPRLRVHDRRPGRRPRRRPGATSRAGMSGGVAYVLDLEPERVNREMVRARGAARAARTPSSCASWSTQHLAETGSPVAARAAGRLGGRRRPVRQDHADATTSAVLEPARAAAEAEGRDVDEAIMAAVHREWGQRHG